MAMINAQVDLIEIFDNIFIFFSTCLPSCEVQTNRNEQQSPEYILVFFEN